jgi:hypothetical protein
MPAPLRFCAWLLLVLAPPSAGAQQTLGQLLQQNGVSLQPRDSARASRLITNYAVGANESHVAVAYYVRVAADTLPDSLQVSLIHKASGVWRHASVARRRGERWMGSAMRVTLSPSHVFIDTHVNPSAGTLLVLSLELEPRTTLNGWSELLLPGGALLYQRSMVHFAPTHPAMLRLYDPATARDTAVYPLQPYDEVRRTFIQRVREIYARLGEEWFRLNNHHMMAEQFESRIGTPLSDSTGTRIAFIAMFGEGGGSRSSPPVVEVLVVCRDILRSPACTEAELSALRAARPGVSNESILRQALGGRPGPPR